MTERAQPSSQVAVFDYSVTPQAVPYGSGPVALLLAVANTTGAFLDCPQIVFTLPLTLTTNPGAISPSSLDPKWAFDAGNAANEFTASPYAPATGLRNGDTIGLLLAGIEVIEQVGLAEISVQETTANGLGQSWLPVTTVPPGLAITQFSVSALEVAPGSSVKVTWATTAATAVTLTYNGSNHGLKASGTTDPIVIDQMTQFTLTVTGPGQPAYEQITVNVERVLVTSISAEPLSIAQGGQTTLSWTALFAESFTIEPGQIQLPPTAGSQLVTVPQQPTAEVVYSVTANGSNGTQNSAPQVINIEPVQITSFVTEPSRVPIGVSTTLAWATTSAMSCSITPDPGFAVGTSGQGAIPLTSTPVEYSLHADGYLPAEASTTWTIGPIFTSFGITFDPATPTSATLGWISVGATTATFLSENGTFEADPSGFQQLAILPGGQTLYQITVADTAGGQANIQVYLGQLSSSDGSQYLSSLTAACPTGINAEAETMTMSWQAQSQGYPLSALVEYQDGSPPCSFSNCSQDGGGSVVLENGTWGGLWEMIGPDRNAVVTLQFWIDATLASDRRARN